MAQFCILYRRWILAPAMRARSRQRRSPTTARIHDWFPAFRNAKYNNFQFCPGSSSIFLEFIFHGLVRPTTHSGFSVLCVRTHQVLSLGRYFALRFWILSATFPASTWFYFSMGMVEGLVALDDRTN